MVGIDLTIKGNNSRMVTEQTLDREGFFIPQPPQRCHQNRAKSALGIGKREQGCNPSQSHNVLQSRPKSVTYSSKRNNEICTSGSTTRKLKCEIENQPVHGDFRGFIKSKKMSMNQKWMHQGEGPKWKPRNSQVAETKPTYKRDKNDVKQQISVCEVMAKMRSNSSECTGAAAPPSSPKSNTSIVVGKHFVEECPMSTEQPSYLSYAKSKTNPKTSTKNKKSLSYLQEDMTVTNEPSNKLNRDIIEIPTMDMFSTDEPDEESVVIVDQQEQRPNTQSTLYESVYLKDYNESRYYPASIELNRIDRPKVNKNYVRYNPDTYRFKNNRYTKEKVFHKLWDREQLRPPVGNTNAVSACRPSHSLYTGVS